MGYFMLGFCAGIIITGFTCSIIYAKQIANWEDEEQEEDEETEEDLTHDGWSDYN